MRPWRQVLVAVIASSSAVAAPGTVEAQLEFAGRVTGYLEHQFSMSHTDSGWSQLDYDRFRVDLNATAGLNTRASVAVVYQLYRGRTSVVIGELLPAALAPLVDTATVALENQHLLNHAYFTLSPGPVELTAGKQYLTWGAAWAYNPTELFRPKDILEPTYEREGVGALSAKVSLGPLSDAMIALVPEGDFDTSGKLLRARHHVGGFDLSALVAEIYERAAPLAFPSSAAPLERRFTLGGDLSGELLGLGIWIEAAWSEHADRRWLEMTVGGNYTLSDGTLVLVEGYYNGRGQWDDPYPLQSWLGLFTGVSRSLGRGIVYGSLSRPFGQLWTAGIATVTNPGDGSLVIVPSVAYSFAENVDLLFNGVIALGAEGTEFGVNRQGGFLRGRVYF